MTQQEFLADLLERRGAPGHGHNPAWFVELNGGKVIVPTAFEPDPDTCHEEYYYNANNNTLYKRIITRRRPTKAFWKKVSD